MSFSTFFNKLFKKKQPNLSSEEYQQKIQQELKNAQHKYLNKPPSEISKMNVRDITMALQQLNDYCIKKIKKADTDNITKQHSNLIKQATVSEMVSKYIYALIILWKTKKSDYKDLIQVKKSQSKYKPYMQNFDAAYENAKQKFPTDINFKKPSEMWSILMNMVPDEIN